MFEIDRLKRLLLNRTSALILSAAVLADAFLCGSLHLPAALFSALLFAAGYLL